MEKIEFSKLRAALQAAIVPLEVVEGVDARDCVRSWRERIDEISTHHGIEFDEELDHDTSGCILSRMFGVLDGWCGPDGQTHDFRCRASDVVAPSLRIALLTQRAPDDTLARRVDELFQYGVGGDPPKPAWKAWDERLEKLTKNVATQAAVLKAMSPDVRAAIETLIPLAAAVRTVLARFELPDQRRDKPREFNHAGVLLRSSRDDSLQAIGVLRDKSPDGCCVHLLVANGSVGSVGIAMHVSFLLVKSGDLQPEGSWRPFAGWPRKKRGRDPRVGMRLVPRA